MSNTFLNWRFGAWHLQIIRWGDWASYVLDGRSPITWSRNPYHADPKVRANPKWRRIELYEGGALIWGLALAIAMIGAILWGWA